MKHLLDYMCLHVEVFGTGTMILFPPRATPTYSCSLSKLHTILIHVHKFSLQISGILSEVFRFYFGGFIINVIPSGGVNDKFIKKRTSNVLIYVLPSASDC